MYIDNIVVISPGYLDAVVSCISKYSTFSISGYSDVSIACKAIRHLPGYNYLGFAYLHDCIYKEDVESLRELLYKCNILYQGIVDQDDPTSRIPFIFLISKKLGGHLGTLDFLQHVLEDLELYNLRIGYLNYEYVTDLVIKTQMFGTILLQQRTFEVQPLESKDTKNCDNMLRIDLPFEESVLDLFSPLSFKEIDDYYTKYANEPVLLAIRNYLYEPSEELLTEISYLINKEEYLKQVLYRSCLENVLNYDKEWSINERK